MSFKRLATLSALAITAVNAANFRRVTCPDGNIASHAACCPFFSLRDDLQNNLFQNQCGEDVHEAVRLTFHDAITFSEQLKREGKFAGGGADGSVLVFPTVEANFPANLGISDSIDNLVQFLKNHTDVSAADMVQFAGAVGLTNCPGAPQIQFLAGRPNATAPGPIGLIPQPQDDVTSILARFADGGGFTPDEVIALLSSHTIARADHVDPTLDAAPFDSTPFTFDTQIFLEVLLKGVGFPGLGNNTGEVSSPLPKTDDEDVGELRLQSDFALARDPRTACTWQGFVNEQEKMMSAFKAAMAKLAVVAQDVSKLVDCTDVLPPATPPTGKPATFPATKSRADVQQACLIEPFPHLTTDPGAVETLIPHCPDGSMDDCDPIQFTLSGQMEDDDS
ncbi:54S ribosomal protein L12, mitochondrial [Clathrus columnatus]|uniref:Peroxidase n=1 Tax=Clathrus columnatus TaxID=1419009 RepID=A0AAV5APU7_9AGAM|nr:54S ribosomal protein L12, mitochondrial [Clathrus columnatus]